MLIFLLCLLVSRPISFKSDEIKRTEPNIERRKTWPQRFLYKFLFINYAGEKLWPKSSRLIDKKNSKRKKNKKKKWKSKRKKRENQFERATNCYSVYTIFRYVSLTKPKIMLSATVRYATRITTESSHLHHKVQGFHTQNNNSNKSGWCWDQRANEREWERKRRKNGIFRIWESANITLTMHTVVSGAANAVPCVPWMERASEQTIQKKKNNNTNGSGYAENFHQCMFESPAFIRPLMSDRDAPTRSVIHAENAKMYPWSIGSNIKAVSIFSRLFASLSFGMCNAFQKLLCQLSDRFTLNSDAMRWTIELKAA